MRKIIVGSRRSRLAIAQTNWVIERLKELGAPFEFEIKEIVTKGDKIVDVTLSKVGGKGLFVKEIEQAMLNGDIDMAVHSMKDVPSVLPNGLTIGCIPKREDYRDVLISKDCQTLRDLKAGAVVGTSSLRRSAQILAVRPDVTVRWIRGNIDTRLKKLREGNDYDAIILAAAGLKRMGWKDELENAYFLPPDMCVPAVGQGALAIECREDDHELLAALRKLNDERTEKAVLTERAFLHDMEGSCQVPIAGLAQVDENEEIVLTALVASPNGKTVYKETKTGKDPNLLGKDMAALLSSQGAKELVEQVRKELNHE
ncbi:hydroxymethylbilane synthase [Aeribacillus sp. FSL K6-2848]|uniref:hydroxymethylbilane synthase n=1 Tax=unclassified Aeribacillus TaxID=2640495 RepID=UPI0030F7AD4A